MSYGNRTKIVCTIGPRTEDEGSIRKLIDSGMTVARLNGSHNTLDWHIKIIKRIRQVDSYLPILLDLPGRKIRTAKDTSVLNFKNGETIIFTTNQNYVGKSKVLVNYQDLHSDLSKGNTVLADDGTLKFTVVDIQGQDIICKAEVSGLLKPAKGINVPYVKMRSPLVSERDQSIIEMCVEQGVDFVGVSFVDSGEQLKEVYKFLEGSKTEVIAKVENQFGLDNLESIISNSFGILIDRGDLGAETKIFDIPLIQKKIIKTATKYGKPVIVATELLHTMTENPFPTKSEVNDIANAVLDGASALMLSGETAIGEYPFAACKLMQNVAIVTEEQLYSKEVSGFGLKLENNTSEVISECIKMSSLKSKVTKIIAITQSGFSARLISLYRPRQNIIVVTDSIEKCRQFSLFWGVKSYLSSFIFKPTDAENSKVIIENLYVNQVIDQNDTVMVTGVKYPNPKVNTTMNYFEIHKISDLCEIFGWH